MHIDWLPQDILKTPGRLGLTRMPGSRSPINEDLKALQAAGTQYIVCLQQPSEFQHIRPPETIDERANKIEQLGMDFLHEAIGDFTAPSQEQAQRVVQAINARLNRGEDVVVHCFAGLGRAGTIAACTLTTHGFSANTAVDTVRRYRQGAIQTQAQYKFIVAFAQNH